MATLTISEFSCLGDATFVLAPVNIIIGPQGSGKSVTTKLFYFFTDIVSQSVQAAERGDTLEAFKKNLCRQFAMWFPPSAWGTGRFNLNYSAGLMNARVLRKVRGGEVSDEINLSFSDWFTQNYNWMKAEFAKKGPASEEDLFNDEFALTESIDRALKIRHEITGLIAQRLGSEYLEDQTFIPAGRAFFTSIGRLVAGIEQSGSLDPVTIKFAKLFANLRDRQAANVSSIRTKRLGQEFLQRKSRFMSELFGGEVRFENDSEFVLAHDGRRIPFTSLSSGQQELLPMWTLINYLGERDALRRFFPPNVKVRNRGELVYIEEPEAHLFPSAQGLLMEFLIGSVASERSHRKLVLTTHSPYIMSKLNVFLKAGQIAKRRRLADEVAEIVPKECWLSPTQVAAYSIENGVLTNLIDDDGLIDASYLDGVSEVIGSEFDRLLELEI